jgi:hypothetical protein
MNSLDGRFYEKFSDIGRNLAVRVAETRDIYRSASMLRQKKVNVKYFFSGTDQKTLFGVPNKYCATLLPSPAFNAGQANLLEKDAEPVIQPGFGK